MTDVQSSKQNTMDVQACKLTILSTPSGSIQTDTKTLVPNKPTIYKNSSSSITRLSPDELKKR